MFQLDLLEEKTGPRDSAAFEDAVIESAGSEIAIIGLSARLPKSDSYEAFWDTLRQGIDCVDSFPESRRTELEPYLRRMRTLYGSLSLFEGAYLEDISSFDYSFFRLSPKEASLMSPNQRLFLQTAWNALEDGGYGGEALQGSRTGVFIGHNADALHDYKRIIEAVNPEALSLAAPGNLSSMIASRISYLLNLRGPAISVDTACSSSLVAVHLACQSIRSGECDTAIAGSVKLNLLPLDIGIRLGIESSDGRAKPFDDSSDGTGIGDGVVALLLKPLVTAQQDGDHVYAVIKGSAVNQDGSSVGITAPNALAQEDVIVRAWQDAGIDPETITYMEAHGTGTSLGDPIEIDGITRAFSRYTDKSQFCAIGSVKGNIGHLDHAAGIAGLLKGVLSLANKQLPPTLHYRYPNRKISFIDSPVYVNDTLSAWSDEAGVRRCGVSAFGMSGTNCHVVLEEAPSHSRMEETEDDTAGLLCLSAHSESALTRQILAYQQWLKVRKDDEWSLADLCYSAASGRGHYRYRLALVVRGKCELRKLLDGLAAASPGVWNFQDVYYGNPTTVNTGDEDGHGSRELAERIAGPARGDVGLLAEAGRRYVSGSLFDWQRMYGSKRHRRIPLPVYSFDKHRCWVEESAAAKEWLSPLARMENLWLTGEVPSELQEEMEAAFASWGSRLRNEGREIEDKQGSVVLRGECSDLEIGQSVADVWGDLLGYGELHSGMNFYELGGDSIIALRIVNRLGERWGIRMDVPDLLAHPTLRDFAQVVGRRHQAAFQEGLLPSVEAETSPTAPASPSLMPLSTRHSGAVVIPAVPEQEHYAVSSPQQRMYLQQQAYPQDKSYNLPELLHLQGAVDIGKLEMSIQSLIARHEMLRTSFAVVEGEIRQRVHSSVPFRLCVLNIEEWELMETLKGLSEPFDLSHAPLLRAALLRLSADRHVLFLDLHHIVSDGMSAGILVGELAYLYQGVPLRPLKLAYKDYAAWQSQQLQSQRMEKQRQYWMEQCKGEWPVLALPTDYPRPPVKSANGDTFELEVDAELAADIRRLAMLTESTPFMVLLAAYYTLLAKYSGAEDIAVGTPIAGRVSREAESVVGMFVGTLALRCYPGADKTFLQFLAEVKQTALGAYDNGEYPFEELALAVDRRDPSRNPLFDTMFIMQNLNVPDFSGPELSYRHERFPHGTAKYDLMIQAVESGGRLRLIVEYCTDLFREDTVRTMMRHYVTLMQNAIRQPEQTLGECEMLSTDDYRKLFVEFGSRTAPFPAPRRIHECFEEQAVRVPDSLAAQWRGESLTYRKLNEQANRMARRLREHGVSRGTVVGVKSQRSIPMLAGMLAIMKAGGAYLPIDPDYPEDRIAYMLSNSGAKLLLTDRRQPVEGGTLANLSGADPESIAGKQMELELDTDQDMDLKLNLNFHERQPVAQQPEPFVQLSLDDVSLFEEGDGSNLDVPGSADDLMYVIYTSGSTGQPKGVMLPHRCFYNFAHSMNLFYEGELDERDRCLSVTNIAFDVSVCELFMPLLFGAGVILFPEPKLLDSRKLAAVIVEEQVTFAYVPPTLLREVARELNSPGTDLHLNKMLVGVEPIKDETLELFTQLNPRMRILNGYGPTEATICSNIYVYEPGSPTGSVVPIGGPMHGVELLIFGYGDKPAPLGATGELCIAGHGLALGYINQPELTASRFTPHPLQPGQLMYRTGDYAKWLPDGNAMYLGRMDHQVKIRGIRIELGEIRTQLLRHEAVDDAVILVHEDSEGDKRLVAYIVTNYPADLRELRSGLRSKLPDYMIPAAFIPIEGIPLTSNGKVDRKALPDPSFAANAIRDRTMPRTTLETEVAGVWSDLLGGGPLGVTDDFFELGGHSLKAAVLVSRIHQKLGVEVPLSLVFERPTVAGMAAWIEAQIGVQESMTEAESIFHPIKHLESRDYYPMSRAQRRQYVMQLLTGETMMYHVPFAIRIRGILDAKQLERAFMALIVRHEILRTSFHYEDGEFRQCVHPEAVFGLEYEAGEERGGAVPAADLMARFMTPFDLSVPQLLRAQLVTLQQEDCLLLLDLHHIITDGVSMGVLVGELIKLYQGQELPNLRIQYRDYTVWQEERLGGDAYEANEQYWLSSFSGELPILELPTDRPRPSQPNYEGERYDFVLDKELIQRLRGSARERGTTIYTMLLGAYALLLSRYSGQEDIIVGTPVAGRNHADLQGLIGMFINTVAIRSRPQSHLTLEHYLDDVQESVWKALEHQEYPFEELVEKLGIGQDQSRSPLFSTMFILQNMDLAVLQAGELVFELQPFGQGVSKFDLTLEAVETGEELSLRLEYATSLFEERTIGQMARHYQAIVSAITGTSARERKLEDLEILSDEERQEQLAVFATKGRSVLENKEISNSILYGNAEPGVGSGMPAEAGLALAELGEEPAKWLSIQQQIERQAAITPDATAVVFEQEQWTFRELNERANQLAHSLRRLGVGPERIVALMASRSPLLITGMLAVMKAGGAFVAIDPSYPEERIRWMLEDVGEALLLTEKAYAGRMETALAEWYLDDPDGYAEDKTNPEPVSLPDHLAYVLYTSGSTGRPKGAMIEHRGLASFMKGFRERIPFAEGQAILAMAAVSFDIFLVESLLPLTAGMRIVLAGEEERGDAHQLQKLMAQHAVDVLQITPSRFKWWMAQVGETDSLKALSVLMIGAEPLTASLLGRLRAVTNARIFNLYGPTETTVWTSIQEVTTGDKITIGTPIEGAAMVVLSNKLKLVPTGVIGELCIGGAGVGRGYLSHPEWNDGAFIDNPYLPGERMYRTGDLGRRLAGGEFVYAGRRDYQVKIRGHRVEIGEVEQQLALHGQVQEAVVTAMLEEDGEQALCAYVVMKPESGGDPAAVLRQHLGERLPPYMIPAYIMPLAAIPLTPTGKVDRKALPQPDLTGGSSEAEYSAPVTETERRLAQLWQELLQKERISSLDGFFELGGHSLKAAGLVSRIEQQFGVQLPLRELFQHPTLAGMARLIDEAGEGRYEAIPRQEERAYYPMSRAQKRQYVVQLLAGEATMYHLPFALDIRGKLDLARLEGAFASLIARHESLRTTFHYQGDSFHQKVHPEQQTFKLERSAWAAMTAQRLVVAESGMQETVERLMTRFVRPFDLGSLPLVRGQLVPLEEERHLLLLDIHHIVTDGVSVNVLIKELSELYLGYELPQLRIQYRDYAVWQEERLNGDAYAAHEKYWLDTFSGELPVLELPADYPRPAVTSYEGRKHEFMLDADLTQAARRLAQNQGTTLYTVLLGAYALLLGKYSGQEDVIVGSPVAGRTHPDLEGLIGMFINTVAIRIRPQDEQSISDYVRELHGEVLLALEHQEYPFEELVERLGLKQAYGRNPLFDTMFILQNMERSNFTAGELVFEPIRFEQGVSKFDLTLEAVERDGVIELQMEYATSLFEEDTIRRMAEHYRAILAEMTSEANAKRTLGDVELTD